MEKLLKKNAQGKKDKDKSSICYECKKHEHLKSKCPELEKGQDKKKYLEIKEKKGLMSIEEDLDDTSSNAILSRKGIG